MKILFPDSVCQTLLKVTSVNLTFFPLLRRANIFSLTFFFFLCGFHFFFLFPSYENDLFFSRFIYWVVFIRETKSPNILGSQGVARSLQLDFLGHKTFWHHFFWTDSIDAVSGGNRMAGRTCCDF